MSVLINFLLQNTNLVSVLSKNLPKFCWSCLTGLTHFANSVFCLDRFHSTCKKKWVLYITHYGKSCGITITNHIVVQFRHVSLYIWKKWLLYNADYGKCFGKRPNKSQLQSNILGLTHDSQSFTDCQIIDSPLQT